LRVSISKLQNFNARQHSGQSGYRKLKDVKVIAKNDQPAVQRQSGRGRYARLVQGPVQIMRLRQASMGIPDANSREAFMFNEQMLS
jgi:hypothetical protein